MAKHDEEVALSFKIEEFVQGGIGIEDGIYRFEKCHTKTFAYPNSTATATVMEILAQPGRINGKKFEPVGPVKEQIYSVGDTNKFAPTSNGLGFKLIPGAVGKFSAGCNMFIFLDNLIKAGFPEDNFDNDTSVFDGLVVRIQNIAAPKREGLQSSLVAGAAAGNAPQREKTIPVVAEILMMPGETSAKSGSTAVKPAAAAAAKKEVAKAEPEGDSSELLSTYLTAALSGEKTIAKAKVRVSIFQAMNKAGVAVPDRDEAMKTFANDEALGAVLMGIGDGYVIDGTSIQGM